RLVPAKPGPFPGNPLHFLLARRLVEAGVPVVHFNLGYWDWHGNNFVQGRHHNDHAQFVLCAGGGFRGGAVVGATDKLGERVVDKFYKIESFGRTLYHLLGIDPDTIVNTPANRPVKLIAEDAPLLREAIA